MKTVIIADDLTGANDTGAALAKNGFKVATLDVIEDLGDYQDYDALAFHTDSRGVASGEAYRRVNEDTKKVLAAGLKPKFFSKRCDSTLRGNMGSEIDGMLDALPDGTVAMVAPAFPDSDKIIIGDFLLVSGTPVEKTDVANDPTSPVTSSRVSKIIAKQSKKEVAVISLETILEGAAAIEDNIQALVKNGARIICFDTSTNEDLQQIAHAVKNSGLNFITVDPGAFTNAVAAEYTEKEQVKQKQKALFIVGTASGIIVDQLANLKAQFDPLMVKINAEKLLYPDQKKEEVKRVVGAIVQKSRDNQILVVATMIDKEDKLNLQQAAKKANLTVPEASEAICEGVSEIGYQIFKQMQGTIGGVYVSGGDISKSFLKMVGSKGITIKDEIIPLAVYGRIIGGILDNKPLVTKGGLIGDKQTLAQCADYLTTKMSSSFYESEN